MYTIFRESDWYESVIHREFITREDLTVAETTYQWERQMDPYDMIWSEDADF